MAVQREFLEKSIAAHYHEIVDIRHRLHASPQLAYQESFAAELIREELERLSIPCESGIAETGIVGVIEPSERKGGRSVALRADMDALPVMEATGLPWASTRPGIMHACGHDGHVAMLIGAARVLAEHRDLLPCPVKLVFQPAEEGGMGGRLMVEAGVLTPKIGRYEVFSAFALHGNPHGRVGEFIMRKGTMMAALDDIEVTLKGRGGHASAPADAIDPVIAAAHVLTALQTIVSRNVSPFEQAVVTVARLQAGSKPNVIPETAVMTANIRSLNAETRELVISRLEGLVSNVAAAFCCEASIRHLLSHPATVNDAEAAAYIMNKAASCLGEERVIEKPHPSMGSEDFSYFCQAVPSCIGYVGVMPPDRNEYPGLHNDHFDFTDEALSTGIMLYCTYALNAGDLEERLKHR